MILTVTLRTVDASGRDVTRPIRIEPCCDGSDEWRVVSDDSAQRAQQRHYQKKKARRERRKRSE